MRLLALRVREVGCFSEPVAVEAVASGINLLSGPNERGKSTLYQALRTVLFEKHSSKAKAARDLQPYAGGAPLIELDLELAGVSWRLRKQYLSSRSALLERHDGREVLRGEDAEDRLAALLAEAVGGPEGLAMVWAGQTEATVLPDMQAAPAALLRGAVERELTDAAAGNEAERVRRAVTAALAALVTDARGEPRGRLKAARDRKARIEAELAGARNKLDAAFERLAKLKSAQDRLVVLADPAARQRRAEGLAAAAIRLEQARIAAERRKAASADYERLEAAVEAASGRLRQYDEVTAELAGLKRAAAEDTAAREAAEALLRSADERLKAGEARLEAIAAEQAELQQRLQWTRELEAVLGRLTLAERQMAAVLPRLRLDYLPGVAPLTAADGRVLGDAVETVIEAAMTVEIPGVGRLTLTPGRSTDVDEMRAAITADEGVASGLRRSAEAAGWPLDVAAVPAVEAAIAALDMERRGAMAAMRQGQAEKQTAARRRSEIVGAEGLRQQRLAALTEALPPPAAREARRSELTAALAAAVQAAREAGALLRALGADPGIGVAGLSPEENYRVAKAESDRAEREQALIEREIHGLESALLRDADDGVEARVAQLLEERESAVSELAAVETEVAALKLIAATFAEVRRASDVRYLEPARRHLAPYLDLVLPGAAAALGSDYAVAGITRAGVSEAPVKLSTGTREQIAVLARLAYARLFAEAGKPRPVVLDDALVYADDERIARMFAALEIAGRHHQVIVLTCRATAFERLEAHRLALSAWRP
jgi:energy-coupling factor transporter ATP-binding protein EcfA2